MKQASHMRNVLHRRTPAAVRFQATGPSCDELTSQGAAHDPSQAPLSRPHSGLNSTSRPSKPPNTLPRSHSLFSPLRLHVKSLSSLSSPTAVPPPPLSSHFFTSASLKPASRSRSAPCLLHLARSRIASSARPQSSPSCSSSETCSCMSCVGS